MTFLIIEDSPSMAALHVRSMLQKEHRLIVVSTIRSAMESAAVLHPDVILMDLGLPDSMPEQTVEAVADLKKASPDSVIAVCTGFLTTSIEARARELGVVELAKKDETFTNGMDIVQRALQKKDCTMDDVLSAGEELLGEAI
jgi:DNA-binding NtrC family response regulator